MFLLGKKPKKSPSMSTSKIITIMILFQMSGVQTFKGFHKDLLPFYKDYFPIQVSFNRFVELQKRVLLPFALFVETCCLGKCTGISFIDSTPNKSM